jgi:hypothetical protein
LLKGSLTFQDTAETMLADTYVWSDAKDPDLYGQWDFEVRMFYFMFIYQGPVYNSHRISNPFYSSSFRPT